MATDQLGNVYVAGEANYNMGGVALIGSADCVVTKFNAAGMVLNTVHLGATFGQTIGQALTTDSNNNVYVTGYTTLGLNGNTLVGTYDMFVAQYNSAGALQWVQEIGPPASYTWGQGIVADPFGDVFVTGFTQGALGGNVLMGNWDLFIASYDASSGTGVLR